MFGGEQETAGNDFVTNFDSICTNLGDAKRLLVVTATLFVGPRPL